MCSVLHNFCCWWYRLQCTTAARVRLSIVVDSVACLCLSVSLYFATRCTPLSPSRLQWFTNNNLVRSAIDGLVYINSAVWMCRKCTAQVCNVIRGIMYGNSCERAPACVCVCVSFVCLSVTHTLRWSVLIAFDALQSGLSQRITPSNIWRHIRTHIASEPAG